LTIAGFYLIGSVFGIITTLQLQELSHLDHPLLKELLRKAPGTYHHSIMVSNLAEQAAERIRANASLVRVGAFYHDIGKMTRPQFFTENQEGVNLHETLDPYSSAKVIIAHVTDGLQMARQYRLPRQVQEFIATHHGDRLIKAFYRKACDSAENPDTVDPARFSYPGPRPSSRETGLVAMADTIEAASSAIQPNNEAAVEKLVNTLVDDMMREGQLDNTGLTLGDINAARESYIETLKGRFHVRVKYEGNEAISAQNSPARVVPAPGRTDSAETAVDLPALPDTPPIS
jgi:putative nucleotidyltransferase with HDIG domain